MFDLYSNHIVADIWRHSFNLRNGYHKDIGFWNFFRISESDISRIYSTRIRWIFASNIYRISKPNTPSNILSKYWMNNCSVALKIINQTRKVPRVDAFIWHISSYYEIMLSTIHALLFLDSIVPAIAKNPEIGHVHIWI